MGAEVPVWMEVEDLLIAALQVVFGLYMLGIGVWGGYCGLRLTVKRSGPFFGVLVLLACAAIGTVGSIVLLSAFI